jgi:hypothetical protein
MWYVVATIATVKSGAGALHCNKTQSWKSGRLHKATSAILSEIGLTILEDEIHFRRK